MHQHINNKRKVIPTLFDVKEKHVEVLADFGF